MKKFLSAIAALIVCAALAACGNGNTADGNTDGNDGTPSAESVAAENAAEETTATETADDEQPEETTAAPVEEAATATENTAVSEETITEEVTEEEDDEPVAEEEIVIEDVADEPVSTTFDDMEAFLDSDLFFLEGKSATAETCLSADLIKLLGGDFYLEKTSFDGGAPFRYAANGDMIMVEQEIDGNVMQSLIRDGKAYSFDHENKLAFYLPAEKEFTDHYKPVEQGIVPENIAGESFVIVDVTIGGKPFRFEYGENSDWAKLYNGDGSLYASIEGADSLEYSLYKFSASSAIPDGIFDIPADYIEIDLVEMMENSISVDELE